MEVAVLLFANLLLTGCAAQDDLRWKTVDGLEVRVKDLQATLKQARAEIVTLQADVIVMKSESNAYESITLDPANPSSCARLDR